MMFEYWNEIARLRDENSQMRYQREVKDREFENLMFENSALYNKLDNLENVFIGQPSSQRSEAQSERSTLL